MFRSVCSDFRYASSVGYLSNSWWAMLDSWLNRDGNGVILFSIASILLEEIRGKGPKNEGKPLAIVPFGKNLKVDEKEFKEKLYET